MMKTDGCRDDEDRPDVGMMKTDGCRDDEDRRM